MLPIHVEHGSPQRFGGVAVVKALQLQVHVVALHPAGLDGQRLKAVPGFAQHGLQVFEAVRVVRKMTELDFAPDALGPDDFAHQQMRLLHNALLRNFSP